MSRENSHPDPGPQSAMPLLVPLTKELRERIAALSAQVDPQAAAEVARLSALCEQLESALHARDAYVQRLRQAFDWAGAILVVLNREGRVELVNEQGCRLLGFPDHDLYQRDWFETCVPAVDRQRMRDIFNRMIAGEIKGFEQLSNTVVARDKALHIVEWHNRILRDATGAVIGTLSSGSDVTQHRRTESALEDSEKRLRAIIETSVDAIVTIDEHGRIEAFNRAATQVFGYSADEAMGRNVSMLMPSPYRDEHGGYIRRYLTTGQAHIVGIGREVVAQRKDGSTFPADLAVSETMLGHRRIFTGVVRDITERKKLEQSVLEIGMRERERIGRDLHDGIGQELTGVAFLAGVLQRELASRNRPESKNAAEIVRLINTTIDHARALVRGLCPVTSDEEGLMAALNRLADSVSEVHAIPCRFDCPRPVLVYDHAISTNLYYIAQEAVNNAIKHSQARHITIGLYAGWKSSSMMISDDGIGLPVNITGNGRGMHTMTYRARLFGATLEFGPGTTGGAVITCTFDNHARLQQQ